jgi:hypothetical protein
LLWRGEEPSDAVNEPVGRLKSGGGAFGWDDRAGACFVVSHGFQIVGLRKKNRQVLVDARLMFRQPGKFALYALMPSEKPAGALEDERGGRMEGGKTRIASGLAVQIDIELGSSRDKALVGLFKAALGFGLHRSNPSRRISCINGVRS